MTIVVTSGYTVVAIETVRGIDEVPNAINVFLFTRSHGQTWVKTII